MNIKARKRLSAALANFGVWGGCFIIPAIVELTTGHRYCAVIAMGVVALPALWASKKIDEKIKESEPPTDYNKEIRDWFSDYERE